MNSLKSLNTPLLAVLLLIAGNATARAQTTQQTGDQGQSGTTTPKKKTAADAAASKSPGAPASASSATPPASTAPAGKSAAAAPASTPGNSAPASKPDTTQKTPPAKSAAMVWVNTDSGVYHKPGTRWYGKTKQGKYMTEADAIKAGYHAAKKQ
ncbi:MAG TPA: hypothetical protein VGR03_14200 [Candidatus Acidoferrum sp.]|nr:hypothetical protein [Candidatus Acidoferrum sp.]